MRLLFRFRSKKGYFFDRIVFSIYNNVFYTNKGTVAMNDILYYVYIRDLDKKIVEQLSLF